ncbi:hypothetical protein APA20_28200, partial [Pseudomonas aeruginosa]
MHESAAPRRNDHTGELRHDLRSARNPRCRRHLQASLRQLHRRRVRASGQGPVLHQHLAGERPADR